MFVCLVFVCLFVCLFVCSIVPLDNCSLTWRRPHYRWWSSNFDLNLALMAIEQWHSFGVSRILWHESSVYMVISNESWPQHLAVVERLVAELSLPVLSGYICPDRHRTKISLIHGYSLATVAVNIHIRT